MALAAVSTCMYKAGFSTTAFSSRTSWARISSTRRRKTFARTATSAGAAASASAVFRQCSTQRTSSRTTAACAADLVEDLRPIAAEPLGQRFEDRSAADGADRRRGAGDEVVARPGHHRPLRADLHQAPLAPR